MQDFSLKGFSIKRYEPPEKGTFSPGEPPIEALLMFCIKPYTLLGDLTLSHKCFTGTALNNNN